MARKPKANRQLEGAGEFLGEDTEKDALDKIAAAKAAAETEAAKDKAKGDNGGPIMDEAAWRRAVNESIAEDLEIERLQGQVAECRGRLSSIRKVAKSCGVDWDVVKDYRKVQRRIRNGEMGEIVTEHRRMGELMALMNCPLYTQWDLFKLPEQLADGADAKPGMDAELQGQAAYRNSEPSTNNPFQAGTEEHVLWRQGWNNAQTATATSMGATH